MKACQKRALPFFDKRVFAPTRAFSRIKCAKTHSGPTSAVGSAEASSAGPRPAQSIFRDVHAAAKNGLNLIRGLRAANSARLFLQSVKRPPAAGAGFLSGKTIRFGRKCRSSLSLCRSVTPTKNLTRKLQYFIDSLCFSAIF